MSQPDLSIALAIQNELVGFRLLELPPSLLPHIQLGDVKVRLNRIGRTSTKP